MGDLRLTRFQSQQLTEEISDKIKRDLDEFFQERCSYGDQAGINGYKQLKTCHDNRYNVYSQMNNNNLNKFHMDFDQTGETGVTCLKNGDNHRQDGQVNLLFFEKYLVNGF